MSHIRTTTNEFINALKLVDLFQAPLIEIIIGDEAGIKKKQSIFYRVSIESDAITLVGYLVSTVKSSTFATEIVTEEEYMSKRHFWVGDPRVVFSDYNGANDKKLGSLVWAATTYRANGYSKFFVDLNAPIISIEYSLKQLNRLSAETIAARNSFIENLKGKTDGTIGITTTDTILDQAPAGLVPTGYASN